MRRITILDSVLRDCNVETEFGTIKASRSFAVLQAHALMGHVVTLRRQRELAFILDMRPLIDLSPRTRAIAILGWWKAPQESFDFFLTACAVAFLNPGKEFTVHQRIKGGVGGEQEFFVTYYVDTFSYFLKLISARKFK